MLITVVGSLLAITFIAYWWGAFKLSKFAFRVSTGAGIMVLLVPPYTFMFAMKLQQEEKELPMAAWLFGIVASGLLVAAFFQPLQRVSKGLPAVPPPVEEERPVVETPKPAVKKVEKPVEKKVETPPTDGSVVPPNGTTPANGAAAPTGTPAKDPSKTAQPVVAPSGSAPTPAKTEAQPIKK